MLRKKVFKYYEYIITKIKIIWKQHVYRFKGVNLKYILKTDQKSDKLIIVFSSCTRRGIKARYNYMRTLSHIHVNQLYILDDFATDKRGSYYIGSDLSFNEEDATMSLISEVIEKLNIKERVFIGSSKGGWAAINFGCMFKNAIIIAGGPQYYLGDYLVASGNLEALQHIVGEQNETNIKLLNHYLEKKIRANKYISTQTIYMHYSILEHTYEEHIKDMLSELRRDKYNVICDIQRYSNHSDISLYFPDFLLRTIKDIL